MSDARVTLQPAGADGLAYVERLLEANDLPARDVRSKPDCFYVGYDGGRRVGVGGVEPCGTAGLLRSVAVEASVRERGYGTALCEALEARARADGIDDLYLLTTTAAAFFADRGYGPVARDGVPGPIQETTQFSDLCPASATCLRKSL
jgi:amino-acid N-acetyltransferase